MTNKEFNNEYKNCNKKDFNENEFTVKYHFRTTKRQLIFRMVLTGIMLALIGAVSVIDILLESIKIPVSDQVFIEMSFLDTIIICIAIGILGPIFSMLLGFLAPWFHNLVHNFEHGWLQPFINSFANIIIVIFVWFTFYIVFKNSPIHKEKNKKVMLLKRWIPAIIEIIFISILSTITFILALYIDSKLHTHVHSIYNVDHNHNGILAFAQLNINIIFAIFGWNLLRYTFAISIFTILENKLKQINHRYK